MSLGQSLGRKNVFHSSNENSTSRRRRFSLQETETQRKFYETKMGSTENMPIIKDYGRLESIDESDNVTNSSKLVNSRADFPHKNKLGPKRSMSLTALKDSMSNSFEAIQTNVFCPQSLSEISQKTNDFFSKSLRPLVGAIQNKFKTKDEFGITKNLENEDEIGKKFKLKRSLSESLCNATTNWRKVEKSYSMDLLYNATKDGMVETDGKINYFPNCDATVWLRSCTQPVHEPLEGETTGTIPKWLKGQLLRNGPGRIQVGPDTFNHIFDGSALIHRFHFCNGKVTYQNRFLESESYKRDTKAQRIVMNYFATIGHPDPCKTILQNISSTFSFEEQFTDNAQISLYPYGDGLYALTESPYIHRIDPTTLETKERIDLTTYLNIFNHTAHPHVLNDGTVFNIGQGIGSSGPVYSICKFSNSVNPESDNKGEDSIFSSAQIVGSVNSQWVLNPSYMHSFAITEHYFVVIEQPLVVSVPSMIKGILKHEPLIKALQWWDKETKLHVINRKTGKVHPLSYQTETFFYLHTINAYEESDCIVLDIASYKNAEMLNCMFVEALKNASYNPTYARSFRGRPKRWVLPLNPRKNPNTSIIDIPIKNTCSTAFWISQKIIAIQPEILANIGCEVPRINYEKHNGKPYRYFYAICSDVDHTNPGTLVKVDVVNKTHLEWSEDNVYPSEPIFIENPNSQSEDDGIVLSSLLRCKGMDNQICLLILDAKQFQEIGRVEFLCPGPVPKCLHGWFVPDNQLKGSQEPE